MTPLVNALGGGEDGWAQRLLNSLRGLCTPAGEVRSGNICKTCLGCINGTREQLYYERSMVESLRFRHHGRPSDFRDAHDKHCPLCSEAWTKFSAAHGSQKDAIELLEQGDSFLECGISKEPQDDAFVMILFYSKRAIEVLNLNPGPAHHVCHYVRFVPSEGFDDAAFGQATSLSTWSDETWNLATRCIENCVSKHSHCNEDEFPGWRPTRLLDLGAALSDSDRIRVVVSDEDNIQGLYMTLSHCWGKAEFLKLLQDNEKELRTGFPTNRLTKTFNEAIRVTRRLGIRYLWIDSLCIIQDSREDWLREAVLMQRVYANAYCNIAATASNSSDGGLFREREPSELHRTEYELSFTALDRKNPVKRLTFLSEMYWRDELDQAPLNTRSWVMQERLLCRRALHFTRKELVFECREHTACETYPLGFPKQVKTAGFFKKPSLTQGLGKDQSNQLSTGFWNDFVNSYVECRITKPSDRLIAISGIARHVQSITGDQYVAGMWLSTLARSILWLANDYVYPHDASLLPSSQSDSSFPSFSWASTSARTRISWSEALESKIRVSNVNIDSEHDDLSGIIHSGSLHLHGRLKTGWLRQQDVPDTAWYRWALYVSDTNTPTDPVKITDIVMLDHAENAASTFAKEEPIFFMLAGQFGKNFADCLLLRCVDSEASTLRRIGLARGIFVDWIFGRAVKSDDEENLLDRLLAVQEDEHLMPCLRYDKESEHPHELLLI